MYFYIIFDFENYLDNLDYLFTYLSEYYGKNYIKGNQYLYLTRYNYVQEQEVQ